jgi:hypothetical protein
MGIFEECIAPGKVVIAGAKLDSIIESLDKEDKDSLLTALRDTRISSSRISEVLIKRGHNAGRDAVRSWRKREGIE